MKKCIVQCHYQQDFLGGPLREKGALLRIALMVMSLLLTPLLQAGQPDQQVAPMLLNPDLAPQSPAGHIGYFRETGGSHTIESLLASESGSEPGPVHFTQTPEAAPGFGYTDDIIWLRLPLASSANGAHDWLLHSEIRFLRPIDVWLVHDGPASDGSTGKIQHLLHNSAASTFGERDLKFRHLSARIPLSEGEQGTLYIRFGSKGVAVFPFQLTTVERANVFERNEALVLIAFIAFLFTLSLVTLAHFLAVRRPALLLYGLQELALALYMAHLEGWTFAFLWPNAPSWNAMASGPLGHLTVFTAVCFTITFLDTAHRAPRLHRVLQAYAAITVCLALSCFAMDTALANQIGLISSGIGSLLVMAIALHIARVKSASEARYFLAAWIARLAGLVPFLMTLSGLFEASPRQGLMYLEAGMALQALVFYAGLAAQIRRVNDDLLSTREQLIDSLHERLEEARERLALEQENDRVVRALLRNSELLASTAHDVNQPIAALRLNLRMHNRSNQDPAVVEAMDRTLSELQELLLASIEEARETGERSAVSKEAAQPVVLGTLLREVVEELGPMAAEKHISLRCRECPVVINVPRIALKRCIMNLVSNALRATDSGGVLLAARRRSDSWLLQVWDTGSGIEAERLQNLTDAFVKGEESPGTGLGLAIVKELCDRYGWSLSITSQTGRGSIFSMRLKSALPDS